MTGFERIVHAVSHVSGPLVVCLECRDLLQLQALSKTMPAFSGRLFEYVQREFKFVDVSALKDDSINTQDVIRLVKAFGAERLTVRLPEEPALVLPALPKALKLAQAAAKATKARNLHEATTGLMATSAVGTFKFQGDMLERLCKFAESSMAKSVAEDIPTSGTPIIHAALGSSADGTLSKVMISMAVYGGSIFLTARLEKETEAQDSKLVDALALDVTGVCEGLVLHLKNVLVHPGQWCRASGLVSVTDPKALRAAAIADGVLCALCVKQVDQAQIAKLQSTSLHALSLDAIRRPKGYAQAA